MSICQAEHDRALALTRAAASFVRDVWAVRHDFLQALELRDPLARWRALQPVAFLARETSGRRVACRLHEIRHADARRDRRAPVFGGKRRAREAGTNHWLGRGLQ